MRDLGLVSVDEMLMEMTSNVAAVSLETNGDSSFFAGETIANLRGLNTGFGTRTLTLVDGRRVPPSTNGGAVDLSMVPSVLVGRMETVTGGAGATYGSDAMAGVVNIITERNLEGTRVSASYGQTHEGDGENYSVSLASGLSVLEGKGHVTFGVEHQTTDPIYNCHEARDWCRRSWNYIDNASNTGNGFGPTDPNVLDELPLIPNPAFPGNPRYTVLDNVRYLHTSTGGSLHTFNNNPDDPWNGEFLEFTPDGLGIVPYNTEADGLTGAMRQYAYGGASRRVQGGEGMLYSHGATLRSGRKRNNIYANFRYDLDNGITFNAEASFNRNEGVNPRNTPGHYNDTLCIRDDNAFIQPEMGMSADAREALEARRNANGCSFNSSVTSARTGTWFYKNWSDQIQGQAATETDQTRLALSATGGMFGGDNWTWDTHLQYGKTERFQALTGYQTNHRFSMAIDSVIDSETGEPVCRVNANPAQGDIWRDVWKNYFQGIRDFNDVAPTTAEATAIVDALREGCQPLNPFGLAASPDAIAYAWGELLEYTYTDQWLFSGSVSGAFWKGFGAGPAQLAAGIDWRDQTTDNVAAGHPNPIIRQDYSSQYGDSWDGGNEVGDIFAEIEIPLLRDKALAHYLMINVANRRTKSTTSRTYESDGHHVSVDRYSDSWKASLVWEPTDWMTVRMTRSADIRQPSARELFFRQTVRGGGYGNGTPNPWREGNYGNIDDTWDTIRGANPNLRNEESITETLGLVFQPGGWARNLQFAVDYYRINIKGGVAYSSQFGVEEDDNELELPFTLYQCYYKEDPFYCGLIEFGPPTLEEPNNPRSDIVSIMTTYENAEPYWSSGVDFSARYSKRLSNGGSYSIRLMATKNIEQSVCTEVERVDGENVCVTRYNAVGQTGGRIGSTSVLSNYTPAPEWSGNLFGTYRKGPWSFTAQARYTGAAQGSMFWVGPDDSRFRPDAWLTISKNRMPSWITWNSTVNYDFGRSQLTSGGALESLRLSLRIENLFDKQPHFWSGGRIAGVNTRFFSGMGRTYRLNMEMAF